MQSSNSNSNSNSSHEDNPMQFTENIEYGGKTYITRDLPDTIRYTVKMIDHVCNSQAALEQQISHLQQKLDVFVMNLSALQYAHDRLSIELVQQLNQLESGDLPVNLVNE